MNSGDHGDEAGRARFAELVLEELRHAGFGHARCDSEEFTILYLDASGDGAPARLHLEAGYHDWRRLPPGEQRRYAADFVMAMVSGEEQQSWEDARPALRPVLRTVGFAHGFAPMVPVCREVLPFVSEYLVVDSADAMAYVTADQARQWDVAPADLFAVARTNLTDHRADLRVMSAPGKATVRVVDDGDGYVTSWLLADGWLAGMAEVVGSRPVAFIPDHTGIWVTSDRPDALDRFFSVVEKEYDDASRPLSPAAYTVDVTGAVVPYTAPDDHPLAVATRRAATILALDAYAAQYEQIKEADATGGERGRPIPAELGALEWPDGSLTTEAVWEADKDVLLPHADHIRFVDAANDFHVPWDALCREADVVAVQDMTPARYRVPAQPAAGLVIRLRAAAQNL